MAHVDVNIRARLDGCLSTASLHLLQAFLLEKRAALLMADDLACEPTRSILLKSAAALALECGLNQEAIDLILRATGGNPPLWIVDELRVLLKRAQEGIDVPLEEME
jgi:hypothetical protein